MAAHPHSLQDLLRNTDDGGAIPEDNHPLYPTVNPLIYPPASARSDEDKSMRIFCKARPQLYLTGYEDGRVGISPINVADAHQKWVIDKSWGSKLEDAAGFPAFAIINKATGRALRHGHSEHDQVDSMPYREDELEDDVLWSTSQDFGQGYHTIRMYSNIALNLDVVLPDERDTKKKHAGVVKSGSAGVVLQKWMKDRENQLWRIVPV